MQIFIRRIFRWSSIGIASPLKISTMHHKADVSSQAKHVHLSANPMELSFFSWICSVAPAFPVRAQNIKILSEPSEFYDALLRKSSTAKHRIVVSSLYLGTGHLEKALVESIRHRMVDLQGQLKVTFLLDHCRGSRGNINSRSMIAPLLEEQPDSVQVSLYHTIALRGLLRSILPQRFNEVVGLQHMKLYIFDNTIIISGANLSHDYFTNRQDRYVIIEDCEDLANFYVNLVHKVCEFSFQLLPNGSTELHSAWPPDCHPYNGDKNKFIDNAQRQIEKIIKPTTIESKNIPKNTSDTWVYPLVQMGQLKIHQDSEVTLDLLQRSPPGSQIHLATGYFNLPKQYMDIILNKSEATYHILTAHPTANGFLNAPGLAGGIPALYTQLAKDFFLRSCALKQHNRVQIQEYIQPGWTYHGKGLWLTLPGQQFPSLTLIGSPNFGSRSVDRDLETQIAIVTSNEELQSRLADERNRLYGKGHEVNKATFTRNDRQVPLWVFCISRFFRRLF
ncbi:CDP-diacylglycerol--glycerol-3-phosphate 3-phosphatidyltransferase, mitochondrial [Thrips palmi]|uniref:CDP-diacylglycerol--glycerol-3-phosphate 3-phosphatidyltransferase n=1 Tax=Thrips palmi TaxID=161013 RepID=A0A6P8ZVV7_THRPL|nr:CDP-diacylglycerol--glycerol-3-phosphate 3-phosphatidyltransferase, mitochondrial [Thrips palmi]